MTRLRATFYFHLRGLYVDRALLGQTVPAQVDGHDLEVAFPMTDVRERALEREPPGHPDPEPWFVRDDPEIEWTKNAGRVTVSDRALPSDRYAIIDVLRVHVFLDGDVSAADVEAGEGIYDVFDRARGVYDRAYPMAERVITRLVGWARTHGRQSWLGLTDEAADAMQHTELVDWDARRRLPVGAAPGRTDWLPVTTGPGQLPHESTLRAVVTDDREPPLAESLLADGVYYAAHAEPIDLRRAVLSAAIACEIKVRDVLRRSASAEVAPVLDVLLSNPRDWSLAAAALFDKPMHAVTTRSLRSADPPLFRRVGRLFEIRNDVAHRGEMPTAEVANDVIRAAIEAFRWLDASPGYRQ